MPAVQREFRRVPKVEMAKIVTEAGTQYNCIIRDLSIGGAKIRIPAGAHIQGRIRITARVFNGERVGYVKWHDETFVGISFEAKTHR